MKTIGSIRTNVDTDLNLLISFDGIVFTQANLIDFVFINTMNEPPRGEFSMIDINSNFVRTTSATFGYIIFTNTSDGAEYKVSQIDIIIEEMQNIGRDGGNSKYRVRWSAGNRNQLNKTTRAYEGTSIQSLEKIYENYNTPVTTFINNSDKNSSDNMIWRCVKENMWEQLDTIVSRSFLENDYLFWSFDDVNNTHKISSLNIERQQKDKFLFIENSEIVGSTDTAKQILTEPSFTVWNYSGSIEGNSIGNNRDKLFPNVSFSGIVDEDIKTDAFSKRTFFEMLDLTGDKKHLDVLNFTGLSDKDGGKGSTEVTFGNLMVKRHFPNNTHSLYAFSDIFRSYKIATFGKTLSLQIYNNVGPSIGSKVTVFKAGNNYKTVGLTLDTYFSDSYIVLSKNIRYNQLASTVGGKKMTSANFITTLTLVSDNFIFNEKASEEYLDSIIKQINV